MIKLDVGGGCPYTMVGLYVGRGLPFAAAGVEEGIVNDAWRIWQSSAELMSDLLFKLLLLAASMWPLRYPALETFMPAHGETHAGTVLPVHWVGAS